MINKGHDNGANKKQLPKLNVNHNDLLPNRHHWMFKCSNEDLGYNDN
jgi:hypothetical protein